MSEHDDDCDYYDTTVPVDNRKNNGDALLGNIPAAARGSSSSSIRSDRYANSQFPQSYSSQPPSAPARSMRFTVKAQSRLRRRRYDVLSSLLLSTGEYLLLESGQVKAFLPMLARLMVPPPPKQHDYDPSRQSSSTSRNHPPPSNKVPMTPQEELALHGTGIASAVVDDFANAHDGTSRSG
jgi:hypothetical protein